MAQEDLSKKVDLAFLSAFYGGLLTEKQRRVLSLHCEEDLSLGEIAAEVGISRQAVHETISRAAARLNGMSYSTFIAGLKKHNVEVNRKMLADLAVNDAAGFAKLVELAKG